MEQIKRNQRATLSNRANKSKGSPNFLHTAWYKQHSNPYDADTNPNGIINLGTAENRVLYDVVQSKLSEINLGNIPEEYTHYCKLSGTDQFREKLSKFFNRFMQPTETLATENVFVMNGCGTVIEALGYALCDEGDAVLVPAPFYTGFKSDLEQRIGVKVAPVHLSSKNPKPFELTNELLENTLMQAENNGLVVKALLLANPNNPLGTFYSEEELEIYAQFCYDYNLHLICDEVYMLSVYDDNATFKSILSIKNFEKYRDIIHVVWGFSKDFSLSGFRCGVAITQNEDLKMSLTSVGYYTSVPTLTQYVMEDLITDTKWLEKLISTNHKRLQKSRSVVVNELTKSNIPFVYPTSGLFVWMNLSKYLKSNTTEAEKELFDSLMDNGLYIVPGLAFECKEHGWFRIIISNDVDILNVALTRLRKATEKTLLMKSGCRRTSSDSVYSLEASVRRPSRIIKVSVNTTLREN